MLNYIYLYLKKCIFFLKKILIKSLLKNLQKNVAISNFIFLKYLKYNKKTFFKSIKKLFFFKNKSILIKQKWRYLKFKKLKIIFLNLKNKSHFFKKNKIKRKFLFIYPIKIFKLKIKKYFNPINFFFKKSIRDNKLFFKKPSIVNKLFLKSFFNSKNIFNFIFKFSNIKYEKLSKNKKIFISINNIIFLPKLNYFLKAGDVIKISFNNKFIAKLIQIYLIKYKKFLKKNLIKNRVLKKIKKKQFYINKIYYDFKKKITFRK